MARPRGTKKQREQQARLITGAGRFIGYIRVSTADQGTNGHSLDGQITRLHEAATREGIALVDLVRDVESGAKQRDGLDDVWARVTAGEAEGILFPKLDRLGRSQLHLASLVEQARDQGISLLSSDEGWQVFRGELRNETLPFLIALAQVKRERISRRTKEGLAAARTKGVALGRPPLNVDLQERATDLRRRGASLQAIADAFNAEGRKTATGAEFKPTTVWRMINRIDPTANPEGGHRGKDLAALQTSAQQPSSNRHPRSTQGPRRSPQALCRPIP
jgi:DNA invertase Pin-like site-specific DNA recombinase